MKDIVLAVGMLALGGWIALVLMSAKLVGDTGHICHEATVQAAQCDNAGDVCATYEQPGPSARWFCLPRTATYTAVAK
jgi:hypothetical protein